MSAHVDLVENRWSGGYQERVGTVHVEAGHVNVDSDAHYRDVIMSSMPDVLAAGAVKWLGALAEHFHSDYFFATEPHDEADCPFADGDRVKLQQVSTAQTASA